MRHLGRTARARLLAGAAAGVLAITASVAQAQDREPITIKPQALESALYDFGGQTGVQVLFAPGLAASKRTAGVSNEADAQLAMARLLQGTGLTYRRDGDMFVIVQEGEGGSPQSGSAAGGGAEVEALIVTAQKREEDIQDVPIAISAFTQEALERSQIAGGPDLMTQVPNMTFTKTNFSSYSIQIRGIGTQAISATTDPAVAVAFNNTPFIRNRFFEQEFYDLQRVEVLRGPQGTLYGRNATAGVVNIISAKPKFVHEARAAADVANYGSTRIEGMINIPLIEDKVALRLAGAWTKRDGYVTNQITGNPIDGRNLWSTRLSLRFEPTEQISANLIWEHFEENDDRLRSGKQLCNKHVVTEIGGVPMPFESRPGENSSPIATYSQGCVAASLYAPESFQTPNGFSLPYYQPLSQLAVPTVTGLDPYLSVSQSRDLRVIESIVDPDYRATTDTAELQVRFELSEHLTLDSETAYSRDALFSTQDYNRFNTAPGAFSYANFYQPARLANARPGILDSDGVFCDPQIGCTDRLVAVDLSTADSRHLSQEFRLSSSFDGQFNFSLGANFLRYDTLDKYYVFINTLSLQAAKAQELNNPYLAGGPYVPGVSDNSECLNPGYLAGNPNVVQGLVTCIYMDPNPIGSLNDLGHNYFLSKNPYRLISYALFGEAYYEIRDDLKVTAGLRWTVDKKHAPQIPSWLLAADSVGYPVKEIVDTEWREPTGRLAIDWKPNLPFTDETLLYASYAHGYKAGGANPPPTVIVAAQLANVAGIVDSVLHPKTFDAEYVDAFELGAKNQLLDGRLTLNLNAFYYDYKGYQISQIIDRTAVNSNFDAEVWGAEFEADWRPLESLRLGLKVGYENTRIADGEQSIDVMDRANGGQPDENGVRWVVAKPFPSVPSNCVLPEWLVTYGGTIRTVVPPPPNFVLGDVGFCVKSYVLGVDPVTRLPYQANPNLTAAGFNAQTRAYWAGYPGFDPSTAPNGGEGFYKDLSGNELPNAPHFTATLTADYTLPLSAGWLATVHGDFYYQSESWWRVFNTPGYDKLKAYSNVNLAATFTNEDAGWKVMAYVKNVFDRDSITGAFLNSDDSGLTTNVFLSEPRLYGVRVTKEWIGGAWLGGLADRRTGPYPFTVEVGGSSNRFEGESEVVVPDWLSIYRPDHFPLAPQTHAFDRDDAREITLTYAPGGRDGWRMSLGGRMGRASNTGYGEDRKNEPEICVGPPFTVCDGKGVENWASSDAADAEEYSLADFKVGRDVGLGAWSEGGSSVLSIGLRYADLTSSTKVSQRSDADHRFIGIDTTLTGVNLYRAVLKYETHWHDYTVDFEAERTFKGVGPILSWEGSRDLLGAPDSGQLSLDWGVSGGVLYGKQKASVREETLEAYINTLYQNVGVIPIPPSTDTTTVVTRYESRSVRTPTVGASLGLSYSIDWMKLSTGYRWERYYDAIDGGVDQRRTYDRTIDGPYFKLAIGFGG